MGSEWLGVGSAIMLVIGSVIMFYPPLDVMIFLSPLYEMIPAENGGIKMGKHILKKGDKVVMHTCMEAHAHRGMVWTCRTDEYFVGEGKHQEGRVFLEGYSGCFATKYLQIVNIK